MPLFALANAGIAIDADFLRDASTSPITLGIFVGYVVGKPLGIVAALVARDELDRHGLRPPVGWPALAGGGAVAGHRLHRLAADRQPRVRGPRRSRRRSSACSARRSRPPRSCLARVPRDRRACRRRCGRASCSAPPRTILDLAAPVDPERDHIRGADATRRSRWSSTATSSARTAARPSRSSASCSPSSGDACATSGATCRSSDVHPHAQLAAEATEAAGAQGAFWEMHDGCSPTRTRCGPRELVAARRAASASTSTASREDAAPARRTRRASPRTSTSADRSGVTGTPTFFVNGRRHYGAYDLETLTREVRTARARALG